MLENFGEFIELYGLVPNGGRIYYQQRSQPPMLIPMFESYVSATGDIEFLRDKISLLEKEMKFWLENRTISVGGYTLARYNVEFDGPRPESYRFTKKYIHVHICNIIRTCLTDKILEQLVT